LLGRRLGQKLSPEDLRLYRLCDEALFYLWDPIGVSDAPEARDEYESYLPRVFALVKASDRVALIAYLNDILGERMGLRPDSEASVRAADFMLRSRDWIAGQPAS
jgi:hypothetical protein